MLKERSYISYKLNTENLKTLYGSNGTVIEFDGERGTIIVKGRTTYHKFENDKMVPYFTTPYSCNIYLNEIIDNLNLTDEIHYDFACSRLYNDLQEYKSYNRYDCNKDIAFTEPYETFVTDKDDLTKSGVYEYGISDITDLILRNVIKITETYYEEITGDLK